MGERGPVRRGVAERLATAPSGRDPTPIDGSYSGTMRSTSSRVRRGLLLTLALVVVAAVVSRLRAPVGRHAEVLPPIGGDTWPPVPVKDDGAA
jgi:hypothetical protein